MKHKKSRIFVIIKRKVEISWVIVKKSHDDTARNSVFKYPENFTIENFKMNLKLLCDYGQMFSDEQLFDGGHSTELYTYSRQEISTIQRKLFFFILNKKDFLEFLETAVSLNFTSKC